jgi:transcriptional regulator with XRE-family HTH domain
MYIFIDNTTIWFIFISIMGKKSVTLLPSSTRILIDLGERIRLARLRRNLSVELVSERAGISRATLWSVEKGAPSVAIGIFVQVLLSIGLEKDLLLVAKDDILGQRLQDARLPLRRRAAKRTKDE